MVGVLPSGAVGRGKPPFAFFEPVRSGRLKPHGPCALLLVQGVELLRAGVPDRANLQRCKTAAGRTSAPEAARLDQESCTPTPDMLQGFLLGTVQIVVSLAVNLAIVLTAGTMAVFLTRRPSWLRIQRYLMGTVLGALTIKLATDHARPAPA
jgi:hypothetical protein